MPEKPNGPHAGELHSVLLEFGSPRQSIGALFTAALLIGSLPADRPLLPRIGLDLADIFLTLAADHDDGPPATITDPPYVGEE